MAPRSLNGEAAGSHWFANHWRRPFACGGRLWLTPTRLVFAPHMLERLLGRSVWECSLSDVTEVYIGAPERAPFGGFTRRLVIARDDALDEFVVWRVEAVAAAISEAAFCP